MGCSGRDDRNNVEPVGELAEFVVSNELLGCATELLLFLPIDKLEGFAVLPRCARLDLQEDKQLAIEGNQVDLAGSSAVASREDVKSYPKEMAARDPFSQPAHFQMRQFHTCSVSISGLPFYLLCPGALVVS